MRKAIVAAAFGLALCGCGVEEGTDGAAETELSAVTAAEAGCLASGGTVRSSMCCLSVTAFPGTCAPGACGCSPTYSHLVPTCACPPGKCFDGTRCVGSPWERERACRATGGIPTTSLCCASAGDYPNSCLTGACGCAPAYSRPTRTCLCPAGKCFDGTGCIAR